MSWTECFSRALAAVDRGEEDADQNLQRLVHSACAVLDTMLPSTAPDHIQKTHGVAERESPVLMAALAASEVLQRAEEVRAAYASQGGKQSASTRRRKSTVLKQWQKDILPEALRMLRTTKMSPSQIGRKLGPKAPDVTPGTIRKFVAALDANRSEKDEEDPK